MYYYISERLNKTDRDKMKHNKAKKKKEQKVALNSQIGKFTSTCKNRDKQAQLRDEICAKNGRKVQNVGTRQTGYSLKLLKCGTIGKY